LRWSPAGPLWRRWLQQGQLQSYQVYIFVASAVLMAWNLWAAG
jgi:hypothetical protein